MASAITFHDVSKYPRYLFQNWNYKKPLNIIISLRWTRLVAKKRVIPVEIDDHFKLFGKEPWEVDYGEKCPVCNVRIDEYGFCSCGSSGD
jgi:hypothetical protein